MGQGDVQGEPSSLGEGVESYPEQPEILGGGDLWGVLTLCPQVEDSVASQRL